MLARIPEYRTLIQHLQQNELPALVTGLGNIQKAHFMLGVQHTLNTPVLVLVKDEATARRLCEDVNEMAGGEIGAVYPAREFLFHAVEGASREYEQIRLSVLHRILTGELSMVFASVDAALQATIPPAQLQSRTYQLKSGDAVALDDVVQRLLKAGYVRRPQVDGIAQFAVRGGILDIYPPHSAAPLRIEFWGDEIDTISYFELDSQRRVEQTDSLLLIPASEVIFDDYTHLIQTLEQTIQSFGDETSTPAKSVLQGDLARLQNGFELPNIDKYLCLAYDDPAMLLDYFAHPMVFVSEYQDLKEAAKQFLFQHGEDLKLLLEEGELSFGADAFVFTFDQLFARIAHAQTIYCDTFFRSNQDVKFKALVDITTLQHAPWNGELSLLTEELGNLSSRKYTCLVLAGTQKAAGVLCDDLNQKEIPAVCQTLKSALGNNSLIITAGNLSGGFEYPSARISLITTARVGNVKIKPRKKRKGEEIKSLQDLSQGDYVVHATHGIGVFEGISKMDVHGIVKDYIKIRYAGTDTLYVPVTQLDLVSKYIGAREDGKLKLNKLNSSEWKKAKSRVKAAVSEMADELIALYANRLQTKGFAFDADNDWQREFEQRFEYQETEDQLRCIDEIKTDMESDRPMDRLLCGDVGFGKTEVALRAAFKCVLNSKQCAILCPTTILAWQHYQTVRKRIGNFPVNVELLSRFRTPKQQKEIVKKLKAGQIDIVIGTHRLVQKDVEFHDLGLAIVDEEQRFGVTTKEKFKELFHGVDMLTLSATPIPRTLNMAMSGIRDMSVIEEAPQNRYPIQSYVIEHDMGVIVAAIQKELRRGGQVYYIHNRIESIHSCAAKIHNFLPDARIAIAHGRMGEEELSDIWQKLLEQQIDILVCTTIIETGVDVANCNTLIVENADNMGLSQLYQLRGRVGRSSRRAYAYFTFRRGKTLSEIASKRLSAIREFTKFGSGFRIAMRDLEIRGAGSILGNKQHGHMESVGYDMYIKLLSEAIAEKKGTPLPPSTEECLVDIQITAHIPEQYISHLSQRIDVYRKIAGIQSSEDAFDVMDELIDRFGEPPKEVAGLIDVALVRGTAARYGFTDISQRNDVIYLYTPTLDMQVVEVLVDTFKHLITVNAGAKPYFALKIPKGIKPIEAIQNVMQILRDRLN